jgi:hypothetical protein
VALLTIAGEIGVEGVKGILIANPYICGSFKAASNHV